MLSPTDEEYQEARRAKLGTQGMLPPLEELAAWIGDQYGSQPLHIRYRKIRVAKDTLPRIDIVFEFEDELTPFYPSIANYNEERRAAITDRFKTIVAHRREYGFDTHRMFVIFSAFEREAREVANEQVTDQELAELIRALDSTGIWTIKTEFAHVIFFFHTDAQLHETENGGLRARCIRMYAEVARKYDEFRYFEMRPVKAYFDSEENFQATYRGSWFNYSRR